MPIANRIRLKYLIWLFKPSLWNPKELHKDINSIDLKRLKKKGITFIIFDLDQTITEYHGKKVSEKVKSKFDEIKKNFKICTLTNCSKRRFEDVKKYFPSIKHTSTKMAKPHEKAYMAAMEILGSKIGETAMIGDRFFTDMLGANKLGIYTIRVDPLLPKTDPLWLKLMRIFEYFLYKLNKRKK